MSRGYIYILTNSSYENDLLKIGRTTRSPEVRAEEIYNRATGIPTPFKVYFKREVLDCRKAEKLIHDRLSSYRIQSSREFFKLPANEAINIINQVCERIDRLSILDKGPENFKKNIPKNASAPERSFREDIYIPGSPGSYRPIQNNSQKLQISRPKRFQWIRDQIRWVLIVICVKVIILILQNHSHSSTYNHSSYNNYNMWRGIK